LLTTLVARGKKFHLDNLCTVKLEFTFLESTFSLLLPTFLSVTPTSVNGTVYTLWIYVCYFTHFLD